MSGFVIEPKPAAHFGVGAVGKLPGIVRGIGADHVGVMTDAALAVSPVLAQVLDILLDAGLPCHVFSGVHPNPTTDDLAAAVAGAAGVPDEVLLNTPRPPTQAHIEAILAARVG